MPVVVGYVPSPEGDAALDVAVAEAVRRREPLIVVAGGGRAGGPRSGGTVTERVDAARAELEQSGLALQLRPPAGGRDAADQIVDAAAESSAELVVIGVRHRSAVGKLLLGSTAQRVLLDAPCQVLAVKA